MITGALDTDLGNTQLGLELKEKTIMPSRIGDEVLLLALDIIQETTLELGSE